MDAKEMRSTSRCNKLHGLPPVIADWQPTAWCPDWDYYGGGGQCVNTLRRDSDRACPFDGKVLPLRAVTVEVRRTGDNI